MNPVSQAENNFYNDPYPSYICIDCGVRKTRRVLTNSPVECHINTCGWCGEEKHVTHARNYGYPIYNAQHEKSKESDR
jgi:hypothetical protein